MPAPGSGHTCPSPAWDCPVSTSLVRTVQLPPPSALLLPVSSSVWGSPPPLPERMFGENVEENRKRVMGGMEAPAARLPVPRARGKWRWLGRVREELIFTPRP